MFKKLFFMFVITGLFLSACQMGVGQKSASDEMNVFAVIANNSSNLTYIVQINSNSSDMKILSQWPIAYSILSFPADELAVLQYYCPTGNDNCKNAEAKMQLRNLILSPNKRYLAWISDVAWCPNTSCYGFEQIILRDTESGLDQTLLQVSLHKDLTSMQTVSFIKWSNDGSKIIYLQSTEASSSIRALDIKTGGVSIIANSTGLIQLSGDEKQTALTYYSANSGWGVMDVTVEGKKIGDFGGQWAHVDAINWSLDQKRLAITARSDNGNNAAKYDLFIADLMSGRIERAFDDGFSYAQPQWSPSGNLIGTIAYSVQAPNDGNIIIFDPNTKNIKTHITIEATNIKWLWSTAGDSILFMVGESSSQRIGICHWNTNQIHPLNFPQQMEDHFKSGDNQLLDVVW